MLNRTINPWNSSLPDPQLVPQYRGVWDAVPYEVADVVSYNNSLFIAHQSTLAGDTPGSSSKWHPIFDSTTIQKLTVEGNALLTSLNRISIELVQSNGLFKNVLDSTLQKLLKTKEGVEAFIGKTTDTLHQSLLSNLAIVEQARAEALKLGAADRRFISTNTSNPRIPTPEEYGELGGYKGKLVLGSKLTETGAVQLLWYESSSGYWKNYGKPTFTQADLNTGIVYASQYGVKDGASLETLMIAIKNTPNGGTLVCPKVKLIHDKKIDTWLWYRNNLTIFGNGLVVEASPDLPDYTGQGSDPGTKTPRFTGGFKFFGCKDIKWYDTTYDGRLDVRTPYGSDSSGSGPKSGWTILNDCDNVQLHNCKGLRCMMDGALIGVLETEYLPEGYGEYEFNRNAPKNILLKDFVAEYNYRQGLSVTETSGGVVIDAGKYAYTGKLPDGPNGVHKWTLPCAGIDLESFFYLGGLNLNIKMINSPEICYNRGIGLLIENGTRYLRCESLWTHHNDGEGVVENGASGTMDNYVNCVSEYNGQSTTWKNVEVHRSGVRPVQRGIIKCSPDIGGLNIRQPCLSPDVSEVTIIATAKKENTRCGNVSVETGGKIEMDIETGKFLGWGPGGDYDHIKVDLPVGQGKFTNNMIENATFSSDFLAAVQINAPGMVVANNSIKHFGGSTPASVVGLKVLAAKLATNNVVEGYPTNTNGNVKGLSLPAVPTFKLFLDGNSKQPNGYSPTGFNFAQKLISDLPDVQLWEITWNGVWDGGAEHNLLWALYGPSSTNLTVLNGRVSYQDGKIVTPLAILDSGHAVARLVCTIKETPHLVVGYFRVTAQLVRR